MSVDPENGAFTALSLCPIQPDRSAPVRVPSRSYAKRTFTWQRCGEWKALDNHDIDNHVGMRL
jgi:hypothetical protein